MRKLGLTALALTMLVALPAAAHHVLGRPTYGLTSDSTDTSALFVEACVGDFLLNMMVFPEVPKPGAQGRLKLYGYRLADGEPLAASVSFALRATSWLGDGEEMALGTQSPIDNIYGQPFEVPEDGHYVVVARFEANGVRHAVELPVTVGEPLATAPLAAAGGAAVLAVGGLALARRRRPQPAAALG